MGLNARGPQLKFVLLLTKSVLYLIVHESFNNMSQQNAECNCWTTYFHPLIQRYPNILYTNFLVCTINKLLLK